jgi:glycerol-3-phosphate dehydrogenase
MTFQRQVLLTQLDQSDTQWDLIIIGGGATGLGIALDGASRGYKTLLLERTDFAKGTSSRSTKLVHGGVRYLKQGHISLVNEALKERGRLHKNAPHLVRKLAFVIPSYRWWEKWFYGIGLKVYDLLAGKRNLGRSRLLSKKETLAALPSLNADQLKGGVLYYDGQFDDARLALNLAQTAVEQGGVVLNYMEVKGLIKENGSICGVKVIDLETQKVYKVKGTNVINATGTAVDEIRKMEDQSSKPMVRPSQGIHLVFPRQFLKGDQALMVPKTEDGRVLFAIPWYDKVVVGTTDTEIDPSLSEPRPLKEELNFVLSHAQKYLSPPPNEDDVLSCFAGWRPLVRPEKGTKTASISRDHTIIISDHNLITITGGKWTTYRHMAEDLIDQLIKRKTLNSLPCQTYELQLHGADTQSKTLTFQSVYGSDQAHINQLIQDHPEYAQPIHPRLPYRKGDLIWAIQSEMARTVDDLLSRRTRSLFLDAQASRESAPQVAEWLAEELGKDQEWIQTQLQDFNHLVESYMWPSGFQINKHNA